jgi:putative flavoprotein involved in K+ transport
MYEWLVEWGFYDRRPRDLPDRSLMRVPNPLVAGGGRSLSLQGLARAGGTLVGRPTGIAGERVTFDGSADANVALGDAFAGWVRQLVDGMVRRAGLDAPPAELDATDVPIDLDATGGPVELDPPTVLDLRAEQITSVVWCTGFTGDFSWLDPGLLDAGGQPLREGTAAVEPGIWYVGLRWLVRRGSSILRGFPQDAATVADEVKARLVGRGAAVSQY